MTNWHIWLILLIVILGFEFKALFSHHVGDTLSESIWWLRTRLWGRLLIVPLWFWLTYHFFIEVTAMNPQSGIWWDDYLVVAAGLLAALLRDYEDYYQTTKDMADEQGG